MSRARGVAAVVLLGLAAAEGASAPAPPSRPDVLLISIDTLRPDRLGAYGYEAARTPVIDALARRGVRFTDATTCFPRTTPAIASLFTGLWPQHHGSRELLQPIGNVTTLAAVLEATGYTTAGVSSTAVLSAAQGLDRGFDAFSSERIHAGQVTARALAHARAATPGRPVFVWAHFFDPHFPYLSWPGRPEPPAHAACRGLDRAFHHERTMSFVELHADQGGRASAAAGSCSAAYDAAIAFVDEQIGVLLREWGASRDLGRTIVVVVADHGEHFGEDGLFYDHGPSLHDAGLAIPLIIAGPGLAPGVRHGPARIEDVAPTILARAGVAASARPRMDGIDLFAPGARPSAAYAESGAPFDPRMTRFVLSGRGEGVHCVNDRRWSLCRSTRSGTLLFDHVADPSFRTNLAGSQPEVEARLARAWELWPPESARRRSVRVSPFKLVELPQLELDGSYRAELYDLRHDAAEARDVGVAFPGVAERLRRLLARFTADLPRPSRPVERSPEDLERLRSLGYIQ
jgi:arylsulfatase A-like enzyme